MAVEGINVALLSVNKKVGVPAGTSTSMILIFCCFSDFPDYKSWLARYFSASIAALHPLAAAVMACR